MELHPWNETQKCHLCPATFAPPHGRKTLFRHYRNIHPDFIFETRRSHLLGRKLKNTEVIPDEDAEAEAEALGLTEEPEEPTIDPVVSQYIGDIFDGILFDQCIRETGRFYDDYVAPLEDEVAETRAELDETKDELEDVKKEVSALEEVRDIQENKIMELTETILDKDKIIADLLKQLEEAKKAKEPEPEEPKEPTKTKFKVDIKKIKISK